MVNSFQISDKQMSSHQRLFPKSPLSIHHQISGSCKLNHGLLGLNRSFIFNEWIFSEKCWTTSYITKQRRTDGQTENIRRKKHAATGGTLKEVITSSFFVSGDVGCAPDLSSVLSVFSRPRQNNFPLLLLLVFSLILLLLLRVRACTCVNPNSHYGWRFTRTHTHTHTHTRTHIHKDTYTYTH